MPTKEELDPYGRGTGSATLGFERPPPLPPMPLPAPPPMVPLGGAVPDRPLAWQGPGDAAAPVPVAYGPTADQAGFGQLSGKGIGQWLAEKKALGGAFEGSIAAGDEMARARARDAANAAAETPAAAPASGEGGPGGDPSKAPAVFKPGSGGSPEAAGAGGGSADPYDKANQLGSLLFGLAMRGSAPTKAGWVNTTKSNVQEGSESAETNQMMRDAVDLAGAAAGKKAEVTKASDEAQAKTYRAAADQAIRTMSEIDEAGEKQQAALDERAAKQAAEAAKLDPDAPGLEGLLNRAKIQAAANQAGSALMAINTGADVNAAMAQNAAARSKMEDRRRSSLDESDKAKVGAAESKKVTALARQEASADYLTQLLKSQASDYAAQGRLAELEGLLAGLEEKKAKIRGDREAKLMGTTTSGQKYRQASGGGPNLELLKYLHGQQVDMDKSTQAIGAKAAGAGAKDKDPTNFSAEERKLTIEAREGARERVKAAQSMLQRDESFGSSIFPSSRSADAADRERLASGTSKERKEGVTNKDNMDRADETYGQRYIFSRKDLLLKTIQEAREKERQFTQQLRAHGQDPEARLGIPDGGTDERGRGAQTAARRRHRQGTEPRRTDARGNARRRPLWIHGGQIRLHSWRVVLHARRNHRSAYQGRLAKRGGLFRNAPLRGRSREPARGRAG